MLIASKYYLPSDYILDIGKSWGVLSCHSGYTLGGGTNSEQVDKAIAENDTTGACPHIKKVLKSNKCAFSWTVVPNFTYNYEYINRYVAAGGLWQNLTAAQTNTRLFISVDLGDGLTAFIGVGQVTNYFGQSPVWCETFFREEQWSESCK